MSTYSLLTNFHIDRLSAVMMGLVGLIGFAVLVFSSRYLNGDRLYGRFMGLLSLLILSVMAMVASDQLYLTWALWVVSNFLLVILMIHKSQWNAALNAGMLAAKTFLLGAVCLAISFGILHSQTGVTSIQKIISSHHEINVAMNTAIILMVIAAMTQSAIWPFHRWLLSSLNSPTPVSAMMHAGLVNGGGVLLARFSSLILPNGALMSTIFMLGIITGLIGTLWKLMQHDVKRMLACSTMGQMGYMLAQCGLGLFPAAIAHICFHGLFKANLFLSSGVAAQEKRITQRQSPSLVVVVLALLGGLFGSYVYALGMNIPWYVNDSRIFLILMAFIVAFEVSVTVMLRFGINKFIYALVSALIIDYFYGVSVYWIDSFLYQLIQPQKINSVHVLGMVLLFATWTMMYFVHHWNQARHLPAVLLRWYVKMLNQSQPHPSTITAYKNQYRY